MHPNVPPPLLPAALRLVRRALWILFGVVLTLLVALALASACLGGSVLVPVTVVLGASALIAAMRYLLHRPWTRLGVSYAVLACVLTYLVSDDATIRQPVAMETFAPNFPGAEESYAVLMRYGKNQPLARNFQVRPSPTLYQGRGAWKPKDPQWAAWLTANRAELETGWSKLEPVHAWWTELNTFERIGDLTPPRIDAEIIAFAPIRLLTQHACAIASLQAIDGNGDAAIETLRPILEVSRKLEPSSRTLVRTMIARTAQKLALDTATFVFDTATVSPEVRARFAAALTGGVAGEQGARRLMSMEYHWAAVCLAAPDIPPFTPFADAASVWVRRCLMPLGPIIFNPRRTINLYGDLTTELQTHATRRNAGDIDAEAQRFLTSRGAHIKNFAGPLLLLWITPSYKKLVENYWTTEDLRAALHARLQQSA